MRKMMRKMEGGRPGCAVLFVLRSAGGYRKVCSVMCITVRLLTDDLVLTHSSTIREPSTLFSSHSRTEDLVSSYRLRGWAHLPSTPVVASNFAQSLLSLLQPGCGVMVGGLGNHISLIV
jgi:hypothetical protein